MITHKMMDMNFQCRGFQYEVGKTYSHNGEIEICDSGFHSCENPLDCLSYYDLTESRFALVEVGGKTENHDDDSKICSAEITVKAELSLPEFIKASVDYLVRSVKVGDVNDGHNSKQASSGDHARQASSGDHAQQASSGHNSKQASSGDHARQASSGHNSKQASSGYNTRQASSGYNTRHVAEGKKSVIASSGHRATAKGIKGTWISLAEYDFDGNCIGFATGCIGKKGLKENTFYRADGGKLVECEQ